MSEALTHPGVGAVFLAVGLLFGIGNWYELIKGKGTGFPFFGAFFLLYGWGVVKIPYFESCWWMAFVIDPWIATRIGWLVWRAGRYRKQS